MHVAVRAKSLLTPWRMDTLGAGIDVVIQIVVESSKWTAESNRRLFI